MHFSDVVLLIVASACTVSASLVPRQAVFPNCALPCLTSANFGSCNTSDIGCLCSSSAFIDSVAQCIQSGCSGTDVQKALSAAQTECANNGVTLPSNVIAATSSVPSASGVSTSSAPSASPSSASTTTNAALTNQFDALSGAVAVLSAAWLAL
ncbi:hypothetical protein HETIRDRAFT_151984 [Heterobasidion irregulare TC 32-1]|uniref:CFEM domain-containing protein n=1 Tax=Heterobasidion irregulare (strain TC 32-1) TaxID=747525 RepID=W4JVT4_HETIT|nr:uncharacterized protein HETIRDRAFT_151984 [Heterobasidion irregulare TC 32-1]ETW77657.1 hypothetical protein HETIRDRAFT_151984 [Heterobasidion irregulare TC 32-1]